MSMGEEEMGFCWCWIRRASSSVVMRIACGCEGWAFFLAFQWCFYRCL